MSPSRRALKASSVALLILSMTVVASAQSIAELRKQAESGDAKAQYQLGLAYQSGEGVKQDYAQAAGWFRKAAEGGNAPAMRQLGVMYGRGQEVPQSHSEEMRWYKLAAGKGNDVAMLYLGYMYRRGDGVPPDSTTALDWFRKSAEKGQSKALYMVGAMYRDGEGVSQDFAEAYFWLNLSTADPPPGSREDRDAVAAKLSPAKLTEMQERCGKWAETHPKIHSFDVQESPAGNAEPAPKQQQDLPHAQGEKVPSQPAKSLSGAFRNERLKRIELKDYPIEAQAGDCIVDGVWVPESNDPEKALVFPEQVRITCTHSVKTCQELKVTLGPMQGIVEIGDIDETIWLQRGSFFGEGCLAGQSLRICTARSIGQSIVIRLQKASTVHALKRDPQFALLFLEYLLSRIVRIEEDLVDQFFNFSERRLARVLLLFEQIGKESKPEYPLKVSQTTLAEMVGTTRARISQFMNGFRKKGFVSYNGGLQINTALITSFLQSRPLSVRKQA